MAVIALERGKGGRYAAAGVGWLKQRSWTSNDFVGEADGIDGELTFQRTWTGRDHTVTDAIGRVRGEHTREGWTGSAGPLMWDDVQYEFAVQSTWKGSFVLRRLNEDLATFTPKSWGRVIEIETLSNAAVPAGLMVFGAWMTIMRQRDSAAGASG